MKIENLSSYQVEMLDKIWSIQDREDLDEWLHSLESHQMQMATVLIELVLLEAIDDCAVCTDFIDQSTKDVIQNIFHNQQG